MDFHLHPQLKTDSVFIEDWLLSQLRLHKNAALPWLILVPRRPDMSELHHLAADDRNQLMQEIARASAILAKVFSPHKVNVGMLGNIVPQLHIHVVGRFTNDPAWPGPVWGQIAHKTYTEPALAERVLKILEATKGVNT